MFVVFSKKDSAEIEIFEVGIFHVVILMYM